MQTYEKRNITHKISRVSFSECSWRLYVSDARQFYPSRPASMPDNSCSRSEYYDWVTDCLAVAGLDWNGHYGGPGQYFADEPIVYFKGKRIIFEQGRGYDV